uniref:Uncharacterized protein n=1 Tax=Ornithorhynchus anatinus TaxID=9258 RepID=A0A6I8NLE9_ORNAN
MPERLQQCKSGPTFQGHRSCSSNSQDLHQAYIPLPCRGNDHLGMHKITKSWECAFYFL